MQSTSYYTHNDLNTPQLVTDQQQIVWQRQSLAFGESTAINATNFEFNLRFPGQYFDKESGLHYNYFRDYDPSLGRYLQSDPIGLAGGLNTYAYVENNPLMNIDPYGLMQGQGTSRGGPGGFPQGALGNRAGPTPPSLKQKIAEAAIKQATKQGAKRLAESVAPGAGVLIGTPASVLLGGLLFSQKLGGCDENGNCASELLPIKEPPVESCPLETQPLPSVITENIY